MGAWAFIVGTFEIVAAIDMWREVPGAGWLGFYAILAGITRTCSVQPRETGEHRGGAHRPQA